MVRSYTLSSRSYLRKTNLPFRTQSKLLMVAGEIEKQHKVKTKTVAIDFGTDDKHYIPRLESG